MKKIFLLPLYCMIIFYACRKSDNAKLPDLIRAPIPLLTKDPSGDLTISAQAPDDFNGKIIVDLYYKDDIKPSKFDLVVTKNGDNANVKTVKENISTYPTTVEVTGSQLSSLFGAPVVVGDNFDFGADATMQNGQKFLAFPAVGVAYGANIFNLPGSSPIVRYSAVCQFNASLYAGDFEVLVDEWNDYAAGTIIPVTVINDHQLSFEYAASDPKPIIVNVDPVTNETSVTKQVYGNYAGEVFSAESVAGSADNYVAPCEGILSVKLDHTSPAGDYGSFVIKLKKEPMISVSKFRYVVAMNIMHIKIANR